MWLVDPQGLGELLDRRLVLDERLDRRGQRGPLGGGRVVLPLDLADGLADLPRQGLLPPRQATGQRLGIGGDVLGVARDTPQLGLGLFELSPARLDLAALDRRDGLAERLRVEPAAAVLAQRLVDLHRQAAGVDLDLPLLLGEGIQGRLAPRALGGLPRLVALAGREVAGLRGERGRLLRLVVERGRLQVGRGRGDGVELAADLVLLGAEVGQGVRVVADLVRAVGQGILARGQLAEPLSLAVGPGQGVELALEFFDPLMDGPEPGVGAAESGEPRGGVGGRGGLLQGVAAGLGLDVGDLPGRPREGPERRVGLQVLRQRAEVVDDLPRRRPALGQGRVALPVPRLRLAPGRVGRVAELRPSPAC